MPSSRNTEKTEVWHRRLRLLILRMAPHHGLSRLVFIITRLNGFLGRWLVKAYIRIYAVNLEEAQFDRIERYKNLNQLFIRRLEDDARDLCSAPQTLMSPCDGAIEQIGAIQHKVLLQVKKQKLSLNGLLRGERALGSAAEPMPDYKRFCILYLSPGDCHRVFMPVDGSLQRMIHMPGRLYPVSPTWHRLLPTVAQQNERVICLFDTALGNMAVILVGAMNVGTIETSWHGIVAPARFTKTVIDYRPQETAIHLRRGEELGCFHLGSAVIVLLDNEQLTWNPSFSKGRRIQLGAELASIASQDERPKADSEKPDSEKPDSEKADGEKADSEKADSEKADIEKADSEKPDSEKADSEAA